MARSLSAPALRSVLEQHTDGEWLILLTIRHDDFEDILGGPLYLVLRNTDVISRLRTFKASHFEAYLPPQSEESYPSVELAVQNIDQQIVEAVRTINTPPHVVIELALASQPNVIEYQSSDFTLTNVGWDAYYVKGTLSYEAFLDEPFPGDTITPQHFPGGF